MAYNEELAYRIRKRLTPLDNVEEKRMMGGLTFMYNDKMCVGVLKDELKCYEMMNIVRSGPSTSLQLAVAPYRIIRDPVPRSVLLLCIPHYLHELCLCAQNAIRWVTLMCPPRLITELKRRDR